MSILMSAVTVTSAADAVTNQTQRVQVRAVKHQQVITATLLSMTEVMNANTAVILHAVQQPVHAIKVQRAITYTVREDALK